MPAMTRRHLIAQASSLTAIGSAALLAGCGIAQPISPASAPLAPTPQTATGPAPLIPLRDFFRNANESGHQLSPDGQYLSWLAPHERRMNVFVRPLANPQATPVRVTSETARSLGGYFWKGDRILYVKDFGGDENFHIVSVDLQGGGLKDLTPGDKVKASIVDDLEDDPQHLLVQHNRRDAKVFDVYRINVVTGHEALIAQNPGNIAGWGTDHDGKLRVATTTDGVNTSLLYRDHEGEPFRTLLTTNFKESVSPLLFTFDNQRLYVSSNRGRDKAALFEFDPKTAREGRLIAEHPEVDMTGLYHSRKRKVLTTAPYVTWKPFRYYFDAETQRMFERLQAKLPGYDVSLVSTTKAEDRFIVATRSDKGPGKRYLYTVATDQLDYLATPTPWLNEAHMASMKPVTYKSRDGLTVHGYLTLPLGVDPKNLPVIVHPHGGPWARDVWGYNPEVQFLANRGYAVFQPNFRGSTGYGRRFLEASFGQWGMAMQDDITDGVKWLIQDGYADPRRIAIYGASYGGYATLMGIVKNPDLYAAAVDYVGVSNLFTFLNTIPPYWAPYKAMMTEMVGDPVKLKDQFTATSPALNAERIQTPLFVAQGAKDPRVVKAESDQMVQALRQRGVPVDYLVKDNEGHGFYNEENRFEFYEAMERFLARHLGKR